MPTPLRSRARVMEREPSPYTAVPLLTETSSSHPSRLIYIPDHFHFRNLSSTSSHTPSSPVPNRLLRLPRVHEMDPVLTVTVVSVLLGAVIAIAFFASYFSKRRSEVQSIAKLEPLADPKQHVRPPQAKKSHSKAHSHSAADKVSSNLDYLVDSPETKDERKK